MSSCLQCADCPGCTGDNYLLKEPIMSKFQLPHRQHGVFSQDLLIFDWIHLALAHAKQFLLDLSIAKSWGLANCAIKYNLQRGGMGLKFRDASRKHNNFEGSFSSSIPAFSIFLLICLSSYKSCAKISLTSRGAACTNGELDLFGDSTKACCLQRLNLALEGQSV